MRVGAVRRRVGHSSTKLTHEQHTLKHGEWGDRDESTFQGDQLALLDAVSKVSKKTIVILVHGRPQTFGLEIRSCPVSNRCSVRCIQKPGEEFGNAMLNLLSGEVNPSAKLSNTWPRSAVQTSSNFLQRVRGKGWRIKKVFWIPTVVVSTHTALRTCFRLHFSILDTDWGTRTFPFDSKCIYYALLLSIVVDVTRCPYIFSPLFGLRSRSLACHAVCLLRFPFLQFSSVPRIRTRLLFFFDHHGLLSLSLSTLLPGV